MDRKTILLKNPADWTEEEQLVIIEQTENTLKPQDNLLDQPPQDPNYQPNPDEVVDKL